MSSSFELRPITPTIGAEILAVNIADALGDTARRSGRRVTIAAAQAPAAVASST